MITRIGSNKYRSNIVIHNHIAYISGITSFENNLKDILKEVDSYLACIGSFKKNILSMALVFPNEEYIDTFHEWLDGVKPTYTVSIGSMSVSLICAL